MEEKVEERVCLRNLSYFFIKNKISNFCNCNKEKLQDGQEVKVDVWIYENGQDKKWE